MMMANTAPKTSEPRLYALRKDEIYLLASMIYNMIMEYIQRRQEHTSGIHAFCLNADKCR